MRAEMFFGAAPDFDTMSSARPAVKPPPPPAVRAKNEPRPPPGSVGSKRGISWAKAVWHYRQGMALEQVKELPKDVRTYIGNFFPGERFTNE